MTRGFAAQKEDPPVHWIPTTVANRQRRLQWARGVSTSLGARALAVVDRGDGNSLFLTINKGHVGRFSSNRRRLAVVLALRINKKPGEQ